MSELEDSYLRLMREPGAPQPRTTTPVANPLEDRYLTLMQNQGKTPEQLKYEQDKRELESSAKLSAVLPNKNPKVRDLADHLMLPPDFVALHMGSLDRPLIDSDYLLTHSPNLSEWAKKPENLSLLTPENTEQLANVEERVSYFGAKWRSSLRTYQFNQQLAPAIMRQGWSTPINDIPEVKQYLESPNTVSEEDRRLLKMDITKAGGVTNWATRVLGAGIEMAAPQVGSYAGAAETSAKVGLGVTALGLLLGQPEAPAIGVKAAELMFSPALIYEFSVGPAAQSFIEYMQTPGQNQHEAYVAAILSGAVQGFVERGMGLERMVMGPVTKNAAKELISSPSFQAIIWRYAKNFSSQVGEESLEEIIQLFVQEGIKPDNIKELLKDRSYEENWDAFLAKVFTPENWASAKAQAIEAGLGTMILGGVTATQAAVGDAQQLRQSRAQQRRVAETLRKANDAIEGKENIKSLGEEAKAAGEDLQSAPLDEMTKSHPEVYAPLESWDKYWQDHGVSGREMAKEVLGDTKAYDAAKETGEDLRIPTARYVAKIAATEHNAFFESELRTLGPDSMTAREAEEFTKTVEDAVGGDETALAELTKRLRGAGFEAQTAEDYGAQMASTLNAMAQRSGIATDQGLLARHGLTVAREMGVPEGALMGQEGRAQTETPEFKNWFGESKVVDKNGDPLIVYHGAKAHFNEFDRSKISSYSANEFGKGFYFDPNSAAASLRGENVMPVYLSLKNPRFVTTADRGGATGWQGENDGLIVLHENYTNKYDPTQWAEVVVEKPTQIKSATANVGTFDPNNPNILYQDAVTLRNSGPIVGAKKNVSRAEIARYLTDRMNGEKLDPIENPEDFDRIVTEAAAEVEHQLKQKNTGLDWYNTDVRHAMAMTMEMIPQLKESVGSQELMLIATALTSPQTQPNGNWRNGALAVEEYFKTGKFSGRNPTNGKYFGGTRGPNIEQSLKLLNHLVESKGVDEAMLWLLTEHPLKEINAVRLSSGLYSAASKVPGKMNSLRLGAFLFGEKVGPFFMNLNGYREVTVDKWATRTYNRLTGRLLDASPTELAQEGMVANPRNEKERAVMKRWIREVAARTHIKEEDAQAVLWFFEQELYDDLGSKATPQSFSQGAETLARERGVDVSGVVREGSEAAHEGQAVGTVAPGTQLLFQGTRAIGAPPVRADGRVELVHYSRAANLTNLDPAFYGRGQAGDEQVRAQQDKEYWVPRTYYGLAVGQAGGYSRETQLGQNTYVTSVKPSELYDFKGDPDGLLAKARAKERGLTALTLYEKLIQEAGYKGYWIQHPSLGMVAASFESLAVEGNQPTQVATQVLSQEKRGFIAISPTRQLHIGLLEKADLSSFIHESGHAYLEIFHDLVKQLRPLATLSETQAQMLNDADVLAKWMGIESLDEMTVEHKEQFARGYEAYTMEGKAPSIALRRAFARFRTWMLALYRTITSLDVKLTNEVREVFDRMLATDEEIDAAKRDLEATPAFTDAVAAGMSEREWSAYQKTVEDANRVARETLERQLMREQMRERESWWRERSTEVAAAVTAELNTNKDYLARSVLRNGTTPDGTEVSPIKLDRKTMKANFDKSALAKMRGMLADDGLSPAEAASLLGFSSGDALVDSLLSGNVVPLAQKVAEETRSRMLAQYGDMRNDGSMADAAKLAVENEGREQVILAELKAIADLNRVVKPVLEARRKDAAQAKRQGTAMLRAIPPLAVFQRIAKGRVSQMRVADLQPGQWLASARKASRAAMDAIIAQDYPTAALQKQRELLSIEMYRKSTIAKETSQANVEYARSLARPSVRARIGKAGPSYLEQIDALLEGVDLAPRSLREVAKRAALKDWIQNQQDAGAPVNEDLLAYAATFAGRSYKDLTVEELSGLADSLRHVAHLATLKNRLLRVAKQREVDAIAGEMQATAELNGRLRAPSIETELPQNRAARSWGRVFASLRKMSSLARQMDGGDNGVFWENIIRPLNEASDAEMDMRLEATRKLQELLAPYQSLRQRLQARATVLTRGRYAGGIFAPVYIPSIKGSLSKAGQLMVALNWGNEINRMRLKDGYGWNDAQVQGVLDQLTEQDWQTVQGIWDLIDSYWPAIRSLAERVDGVAPEKVEPLAIETPYGTMRGGYFPIRWNRDLGARGGEMTVEEQATSAMRGVSMRSTTQHGHRKNRYQGAVNPDLKIRLDLGVVYQHLNEVIHDLTHYEALVDVNRLLRDKRIRGAIEGYFGRESFEQFEGGLKDTARGDVPALSEIERKIDYVRSGVSVAAMGFNFFTAALQPLGITQSMVRIGPKWVAKGLTRWIGNAFSTETTAEFIYDRSSTMRNRNRTMLREINEIRSRIEGNSQITNAYFYFIGKMQSLVDIPTWLGAYEKAFGTDPNMDEATAIALADQAVVDAQSSGRILDLARVQRGSAYEKLFTNFYSFFSATYNLSAESIAKTKSINDVPRLAADMLLLWVVPAALGMFLREAFRGDSGDDDVLTRLWRAQLSYILSGMPYVRELSGAVEGYYDYSGPAGLRVFKELSNLIQQATQGKADRAAWRALNNTSGILLHYPSTQLQRTVEGLIQYTQKDDQNPMILVTGPQKK